jgi:putative N6-adenine-specific DNA methylase
LIEAGLIATGRAPGLGRSLGVERWPYVGSEAGKMLTELREQARRSERPAPSPIIGYDRSEEAIAATRKNARAAGLSKEIATQVRDATLPLGLETIPPGLIVCNPPYGDRLKAGGQKGMKSFYFKLGEAFRQSHGWRAFVLAGNAAFESAFHARPLHRRMLFNGPIECQLLDYRFE